MKLLQVAMPDQVVERYGGETSVAARISIAAVMVLLREGEMKPGEAAETLNVARRQILSLMAKRNIPVANYDPAELQDELQDLQQIAP